MNIRQRFFIAATVALLGIQPVYGQWVQTNGPWTGFDIYDMHVEDSVIYAGTTNGVYRSSDQGLNWEGIDVDSLGFEVMDVVLSGPYLYASNHNGSIFRHIPNAHTWKRHYIKSTTERIELYEGENDVLYARTYSDGIYRSVDFGESWAQVDSAAEIPKVNAICEMNGSLYAGTYGNGVFKYNPATQSWDEWNNNLLSRYVLVLSVYRSADGSASIFAGTLDGLFNRSETENSWTLLTAGMQMKSVENIHSGQDGAYIYMIGGGGMYRSSDGGNTWLWLTNGFPLALPHCIATIDDIVLVGSNNDGVFRSTSFGVLWEPSNTGMVNYSAVDMISAGESLLVACGQNGLFTTNDDGITWVSLFPRSPANEVRYLEQSAGVIFGAAFHGGFRQSTDNGTTWGKYNEPMFEHVEIMDVSKHTLLVGVDNTVFMTRTGGNSWYQPFSGIPSGGVHSIAAHSSAVLATIGGSNFGEYLLSKDDGLHWEIVAGPLSLAGARSPRGAFEDVFVVNAQGIILTSTDSGETWTEVLCHTSGKTHYVETILVHGSVMFAGTREGIFMTSTLGEKWEDFSENLQTTVYSLEVHQGNLYAGTRHKAVFRRPLAEMLPVPVEQIESPSSLSLSQNYPNPVSSATGSGITQIGYEIEKPGYVYLSVCNTLGAECVVLVHEYKNPGTHTATLNTSGLPPGMYFYRLRAEGRSLERKLVVLN